MFSFHKPKIYRSLKGCCICRAKSSSSRFTDSKRYELDFEKCFMIYEQRSGEICNACVLLVKRWKKLPAGSNRNWHHVVDARAGPGTKSIMKMKTRNKEERRLKKKHKHKKILRHNKPPQSPGGLSDDIIMGDDCLSDNESHRSAMSSPTSDVSDDEGRFQRHKDATTTGSSKGRRKKSKPIRVSSFLDLTYWKKTEVCCGIIFKGIGGEVMVDTNLLRPCCSFPKPQATDRQDSHESHDSGVSESGSHEASPLPDEPHEESPIPDVPHNVEEDMAVTMSSSTGTTPGSSSPLVAETPPLSALDSQDSMSSDGAQTLASATAAAAAAVLDLSMSATSRGHKVTPPFPTPLCIELEV